MRCNKYKAVHKRGIGAVRVHQLKAEAVLGRKLRRGERVHHVDENKSNNDNKNLVICGSDAYHFLLHRRTEAYERTGDANKIKCQYCSEFDDPEKITVAGAKGYHRYHKTCKNAYLKSSRITKKEKQNV